MNRIQALNDYAEVKEALARLGERKAALECELGISRCPQHESAKGEHSDDGATSESLKSDHDTREAMRPLIESLCEQYVNRWNIWAIRALQGLVGFGGLDPIRSDRWYHDTVRRGLNQAGAGLTHFLEIGADVPGRYFPDDVAAARAVLRGEDKGEGNLL